MSPDTTETLQAAAADVAKMEPAPEAPKQVAEAKKLSKLEIKRMQMKEERRRRLINNGIPPDKVERVMAEQDHAALPLEKRFERFETVVLRAMQGFQKDLIALRHNDGVISEAMEVNLRAFAKCLEKAGVSPATQEEIINATHDELIAEQKRHEDIKKEQALIKKEAAASKPSLTESPSTPTPAEVPEGATTFGG